MYPPDPPSGGPPDRPIGRDAGRGGDYIPAVPIPNRQGKVPMRAILLLGAVAMAAGCRPYDFGGTVSDQDGLIPADQFARYGAEQAKAVAIGRALAQWGGGTSPDARAVQVSKASDYARSVPGVKTVVADTLGYRLTVTFESGWRTAIVPIADGKGPEAK